MAEFKQIESAVVSLDNQVKILTGNLQKLVTVVNSNSKSQSDLAEKTNKVKQASKEIDKVEKERLSLLKKLKDANSDRIQKNEELRAQLAKQKKVNKDLAKEKLGLLSVYDKEKQKLADLQKKLINVTLEQGKNSKSAKKLGKEVAALNKKVSDAEQGAGRYQRQVGKYPGMVKSAGTAFKGFFAVLKANPVLAIIGLITAAIKIIKKALAPIQPVLDWLSDKIAYIKGLFSGFTNSLQKLGGIVKSVFKGEFREAAKQANELAQGIKGVAEAAEKLNQVLREADRQQKLNDATTARTLGLQKDLRRIVDDITASAKDRAEALRQLKELQISQAEDDIAVAESKLLAIQEKVNAELIARGKNLNVIIQSEEELKTALDEGIITEEDYNTILDARIESYRRLEARQAVSQKLQLLENRVVKAAATEQKKAIKEREEAKIASERDALKETKAILIERKNIVIESQASEDDELLKAYDKYIEEKKKKTDEANESELKATEDLEKAKADLKKEIENAAIQIATDQFNASIDNRLNSFLEANEAEQEILKDRLDKGLISEAQFEKQSKALKLKARQEEARAEKKKAIFDISIATLVAIVKSLPNIPLSLAVAGIGAAQAAVVAAKPIPKFRTGVKDFEGGMAYLHSNEIVNTKDGMFATPMGETLAYIPKGSDVLTAQESAPILEAHKDNGLELKELKAINNTLSKQKQSSVNITDDGMKKTVKTANQRIEYIDTYMRQV